MGSGSKWDGTGARTNSQGHYRVRLALRKPEGLSIGENAVGQRISGLAGRMATAGGSGGFQQVFAIGTKSSVAGLSVHDLGASKDC